MRKQDDSARLISERVKPDEAYLRLDLEGIASLDALARFATSQYQLDDHRVAWVPLTQEPLVAGQ